MFLILPKDVVVNKKKLKILNFLLFQNPKKSQLQKSQNLNTPKMSVKDPDPTDQDALANNLQENSSHHSHHEEEDDFSDTDSASNENEAPVEPYDLKDLPEYACKSLPFIFLNFSY